MAKRKAARSVVTGKFVEKEYAKSHPATTEIETMGSVHKSSSRTRTLNTHHPALRRWLPAIAAVIGVELLIIALLLSFGGLRRERTQRAIERTQTKETTKELRERTVELETQIRNALKDQASVSVLAELLRRLNAELVGVGTSVAIVREQTATPAPSTPRPTPRIAPPSSPQPDNPTPSEPTGGQQGSLKPFVCAQGLGPALGIDCSPDAAMASTQLMCNAGFDDQFAMNCGKDDKDGPEE